MSKLVQISIVHYHFSRHPGSYISVRNSELIWNTKETISASEGETTGNDTNLRLMQVIGADVADLTSVYRDGQSGIKPFYLEGSKRSGNRMLRVEWFDVAEGTIQDEWFQYGRVNLTVSSKHKCTKISFDTVGF